MPEKLRLTMAGWFVSGLHLPVIAGKSYWLAFEQASGNEVVFLSEAANQSRIPHYWTEVQYGPLPGRLELNEAQCNYSPYVMRATVRRP
jgi:hypothetical protein